MIKILDSSGMKACDNYTINALGIPSRELMERAAEACVSMISDGRFDLGHVTADMRYGETTAATAWRSR